MKPSCYLSMVLAIGCATAAEPLAPAKSAAYQGGVSQEQLRIASERLKEEISQLAEAYAKYPGASGDVAILRKTVAEMDKLASKDMASVAKVLMDASRSMDSKMVQGTLNDANSSQKNIQVALRAMADKLARQSDLAAMQKRLEGLAIRQHANLESVKDLASTGPNYQKMPARLRDTFRAKKDEQTALGKEAELALQSLDKLAAETTATEAAGFFKQAATTAQDRKLTARASDALVALDLDFAEAGKNQQEVLDTLKAMIAILDSGKTAEQRTREMASELDDLARKQEALANGTPKMNGQEQEEAAKKQQEIAAKLDIMEERLTQDEPQAATQAQQAAQDAQQAANELEDDRMRREPQRVAQTSEQQGKVADELAKLAESLEKKADEMAGTGQEQEPMDPKEAAMQEAMNSMQEAKTDIELAQLQNSRNQDSSSKANSAMEKMEQAGQQMQQAGQGEKSGAGQSLEAAEKHAQQAANGQGVGQNLSQSAARLDQAMASLQDAMNQMSSQGMQSTQRGQGPGEGGMGGNADSGNRTRTDARGKAAEGQRDALTLQQQDKVAPAYATAVNQYLKNLAEDTDANP